MKVKKMAKKILRSRAYDREAFKDKLEEILGGLLLDFYFSRLSGKIGYIVSFSDRGGVIQGVLDRQIVRLFLHDLRGFKNRKKAAEEVILYLKKVEVGYKRSVEMLVKRAFVLKALKVSLDEQDSKDFWAMVDRAIEVSLGL